MSNAVRELGGPGVVLPWAVGLWQEPVAARSVPAPPAKDSFDARRVRAPSVTSPAVPSEDLRVAKDADIIAAAVVVDVLSTQTARLQAEPTVLVDTATAALAIASAGVDADGAAAHGDDLVRYAIGASGKQREAVAETLAQVLADTQSQGTASLASPQTVVQALRRIEAMSRLLVREATALLEARETTSYRQV